MPDIQIQTAPGQPIQPVETVRTTSPTTSTTSVAPAPGELAAQDALVQQQTGVATAQQGLGAAQAQELEAKASAQDLLSSQAEVERQQAFDLQQAYAKRAAEAQKLADAAEDKVANHKFYDYWSTRDHGDLMTAKINSFLGGFGAGLLGSDKNVALDNINRAIDRDFDKQKEELHSSERIAEMRRKGVTDIYDHLQHDLAALQIKHAAAYKAVAAQAMAVQLRAGIPAEQAKNNILVQQALVAAAKLKVEATQRFERQTVAKSAETTIENVTGKAAGAGGGVEADKNAANFSVLKDHGLWLANEMPKLSTTDIRAINRVMASEEWLDGKTTAKSVLSQVGIDAETGVSSAAKQYLDRTRRAAEALGRVQSGAAIGTEEGRRFMRSLAPNVSDKSDDLQMRAKNIVEDITNRGAFLERPARNGPQASPAGVPPRGTVQRSKKTGAIRIADGQGGWKEASSGGR